MICLSRVGRRCLGVALLPLLMLGGCSAKSGRDTVAAGQTSPARGDGAAVRQQRLAGVQSWGVQLTGYGPTRLRGVEASSFDLVVVDPTDDHAQPWTRAELKRAAQGRLLVAYLSMGAAENYRPYWRPGWRVGQPSWVLWEDPDWPGNFDVAYWHPDWQRLALAQLDQVLDLGFDGVYMDLIDAFERHPNRPTARQEMVDWVCRIAAHAHARNPQFLIIPQNAADLIHEPGYAACVDATGQEETFVYATDRATEAERQQGQLADFAQWRRLGKPVLTLEYASAPALVDQTYRRARAAGLIPYVTTVSLNSLPAGR